MSRKFLVFLLVLVFYSCGLSNQKSKMYVYAFATYKSEPYTFLKQNTKAGLSYAYKHQADSIKDFYLTYAKSKDFLIDGLDTLYFTSKYYKTSDVTFKAYQKKVIQSHNRILIFEKDYGILANLAFGANYLFTKDSLPSLQNEEILKQIMLALNKIEK